MDKINKTILIIFIIVFLMSFSSTEVFSQACCAFPQTGVDIDMQVSYSPTPDFTVPTLDGGTFTLSAQHGKPVIMFVMAYWCPTCYKEAEALAKLHEKYRDSITILALDIDPSSTPESLGKFKERAGNPDYIWAFDKNGKVTIDYRLKALETTFIFDPTGNIVFTDYRSTSFKTLEREIKDYVE